MFGILKVVTVGMFALTSSCFGFKLRYLLVIQYQKGWLWFTKTLTKSVLANWNKSYLVDNPKNEVDKVIAMSFAWWVTSHDALLRLNTCKILIDQWRVIRHGLRMPITILAELANQDIYFFCGRRMSYLSMKKYSNHHQSTYMTILENANYWLSKAVVHWSQTIWECIRLVPSIFFQFTA